MAYSHQFKPTHKEIKQYYEELSGYASHEVSHEGATSTAFQNLLAATCKKADWHLVPQLPIKVKGKQVRPDGTLRDELTSTMATGRPRTPGKENRTIFSSRSLFEAGRGGESSDRGPVSWPIA